MYSTKTAITVSIKDLLDKLDDYDIYSYYVGDFKVGKLFNSPLRTTDKNPSFAIFKGINGGLFFKDHGSGEGGNALKFYSSVRLDIRRVTSIKDGDQVIGNQVRVKVVKNKVAPPFRKAEFEITFGEGISKIGEILDLGVEYGIIQKSGSWFSYDNSKLGQGRDATKALLKDNPELCEDIEGKIMQAIKDSEN